MVISTDIRGRALDKLLGILAKRKVTTYRYLQELVLKDLEAQPEPETQAANFNGLFEKVKK